LLRQRHLDDVAAIIRMNSDPEIMRFVGDGRMSDPVELEKRTRERVGTDFGVGLGYWSVLPESTDIELSYGIQRNAWGRGFATEASRAGLEFGFRVRGLPEIVALTYPDNLRSQRVVAKLGFTSAGMRHAYGQDLLLYRLSRVAYLGSGS
jgi:RimJ/RimL family protein N-acetyltransferase